jgi:hypothetical protein
MPDNVSAKQKAQIVIELRPQHSFVCLLEAAGLGRSTFYYHHKVLQLTHHCHIVEPGNEPYRFRHSTMAARTRIKARESARKDGKAAPVTGEPAALF